MTTLVIDASAFVELVLATPVGVTLARELAASADDLHAPELLDIEVAHVLRRYARIGQLTAPEGVACLAQLDALGIERWSHRDLLPRVWQLRDRCSAYDAAYVALAEVLVAPLVTADARLASVAAQLVTVRLVQ